MAGEKIEKIEDLILLDKDKQIIEYKVKRLTAPGENYGSLMLSVDLTVKTPSGDEQLQLVAKMVPPNEFIQKIFNTQVTFRNEIGFYKHIVPVLQEFQREHGVKEVIDFSPKYYGSRLNLANDDNASVDVHGALVLENLKVAGFINLERTEGFDLDVAKLVLADLARLHAVPLALRLQKPEVFEKKIKPHLSSWRMTEEAFEDLKKTTASLIDKTEKTKPFEKRIFAALNNLMGTRQPRQPFATLTHNDCWINNAMIKIENGKYVKNKLVDFQICDYGSPVKDVVFFLFSSVKTKVLQESYDDLIRYYYDIFKSILEELKCDTTPFSFEAFEEELNLEARTGSQFGHVGFMLFPIFVEKKNVKDITELNRENLNEQQDVSDLHKEKFTYLVEEFVKRNWI